MLDICQFYKGESKPIGSHQTVMLKQLQKDNYLTLFRKAAECSINAIAMTDMEGNVIYVNDSTVKLWGYDYEQEMIGRFVAEFWEGDGILKTFEEVHCKGYSKGEDVGKRKDGSLFNVQYNANIIRDDRGDPLALFGAFVDITKRKKAQRASKKKQQELETKSKELEDANAALRVLLKKREDDKIELEQRVLSNVKKLIEPCLEKLENGRLSERQKTHLEILRTNLNNIISPFARDFTSIYYRLTPQEIQIANLIKYGKTTKEIAAILGLSTKTIEFHRTNIRKNLGLNTRKDNLRTYLLSFK